MSKSKLGLLVAAIATSALGVTGVSANPQSGTQMIQNMNRDALITSPTVLQNTNAQVTSVSQFSDVQPTDWAFTALQSLVERYGCIAGYPNGTFRGNRATSRYEFAAGLNACLDKINELISSGLADKVGKEDLATLQKLQEEFSAELAALKGRVTALETKTATLEAQQFSTTTKLTASAIFAAAGSFGDNAAVSNNRNVTFGGRVRLNFNTSFTGKDLLFTRLQAANIKNNSISNISRLAFDESVAAGDNIFSLDRFFYRFPVGDQLNIIVGSVVNIEDVLDVVNPNLISSETGALSRFARRDPLVFRGQGDGSAAVAARIKFGEQFAVNLAYSANNSSVSGSVPGVTTDSGLFGGGYTASAQVLFTPSRALALGFVYQRGYDPNEVALTSGTGTELANNPRTNLNNTGAFLPNQVLFGSGVSTDRFGFQTNFDLGPNLSLNGRVSYVLARAATGGGTADILSWLTSVTFKDVFAQGNQASIAFGQPPYVIGGNVNRNQESQNPYHLEAFYRFQLNKNISVTPGIITIFNPGTTNVAGTVSNEPIFVGVLRTSFTF